MPDSKTATPSTKLFTVPAPIKRTFDNFPLIIYPPNDLPAGPHHGVGADADGADKPLPALYVFAHEDAARRGRPSFNPSCLKWQALLRLAGVRFRLVPSSNHASPSGALPFLLPASAPLAAPVPASRLARWADAHGARKVGEVRSARADAYQALLDHRIRNAWLYALYLAPANAPLLCALYVDPVSASALVRTTLQHQLRRAAADAIGRSAPAGAPPGARIDPDAILAEADGALGALETALGEDDGWFFGAPDPSPFDCAVFAYTQLLLDPAVAWVDRRLVDLVAGRPGLVAHRERLYGLLWGDEG